MKIKNERVRALRQVAKFLEYCSRGAQPTREEFKTIANLCWINVPMKYRMDRAEIDELQAARPEWVKVGQWVTWEGQTGRVKERILKITEPQPGNYVLWTTLLGKEFFGELPCDFPINYKQVQPCEPEPVTH